MIRNRDAIRQRSRLPWPGGAQAAVTLSLDDGYAATCESTGPALQARSIAATYSIVVSHVGRALEGLETAGWDQWQETCRLGHEIASHGLTHAPLAGPLSDLRRLSVGIRAAPNRRAYLRRLVLTARALRQFDPPDSARQTGIPSVAELAESRSQIARLVGGAPVASFAYPGGRHSAASRRAVIGAGFRSARTTDLGLNSVHCDVFRLRCIVLGPGMTIQDLPVWLERACETRAWLIIGLHLVAEENPTGYPYHCSQSAFQRMLDMLQRQPVWIATQCQVVRHLALQNQDESAR